MSRRRLGPGSHKHCTFARPRNPSGSEAQPRSNSARSPTPYRHTPEHRTRCLDTTACQQGTSPSENMRQYRGPTSPRSARTPPKPGHTPRSRYPKSARQGTPRKAARCIATLHRRRLRPSPGCTRTRLRSRQPVRRPRAPGPWTSMFPLASFSTSLESRAIPASLPQRQQAVRPPPAKQDLRRRFSNAPCFEIGTAPQP